MGFYGSPFEADYEKVTVDVGTDGQRIESRELYRLYVDSKGRWRMEGSRTREGTTVRFAFITDPQKLRGVVIDLDTGGPLHVPPEPPSPAVPRPQGQHAPPKQEPITVEDLGHAVIEGQEAHGRRVTTPSSVSEQWTGLRIEQPLVLFKSKQPTRERTERLFNIRISEPDPSLYAPLDALYPIGK